MTIILAIVIPLFISLIAYSASLTLKHIKYKATIQNLNETLSATRSELASFDEKKNQDISNIKKIADTRINELTETNSMLQEQLFQKTKFIHSGSLLWLLDDPIPFCFRCWECDKQGIHMIPDGFHKDYVKCLKCHDSVLLSQHPKEIK
jgi:hypothetical protein